MIRFILVILTAFLYLILSIPVLLVLLLIRKKKPEVCDKVSRSLIRWIFRVILFFSGTKITVKGQENIPKDRAVLYIGNHRSYFDILVTYTTVPGSCGFVAKKELSRIPLLKNWMELIHCLFLDRSDIKQGLQMILSGCEEIKSGTSICIFPEGTREKEGKLLQPKSGLFVIAAQAAVDVVPVRILYDTPDGRMKLFCKVKVVYGEPMPAAQFAMESRRDLKTLRANKQALLDAWEELGQQA